MLHIFHIVIKLWDFIYFLLLHNKLLWCQMSNLEPEAKPAENNWAKIQL